MNPVILRPGNGEHIAAGASTAVMKATAETHLRRLFDVGGDLSRQHERTTATHAVGTQQTHSTFSKEPCA